MLQDNNSQNIPKLANVQEILEYIENILKPMRISKIPDRIENYQNISKIPKVYPEINHSPYPLIVTFFEKNMAKNSSIKPGNTRKFTSLNLIPQTKRNRTIFSEIFFCLEFLFIYYNFTKPSRTIFLNVRFAIRFRLVCRKNTCSFYTHFFFQGKYPKFPTYPKYLRIPKNIPLKGL